MKSYLLCHFKLQILQRSKVEAFLKHLITLHQAYKTFEVFVFLIEEVKTVLHFCFEKKNKARFKVI